MYLASSSTPAPTQPFPLLRLPPELRNAIYHLVLAHQTATIDASYRLPGLLTTCRQTLAETRPMYYALTRFRCLAEGPTVAWLSALAPACRAVVPEIRYDVRWIIMHAWVMPMPETECYMFQRLLRRLAGKGVKLADGVLKVNFYDWTGRLRAEAGQGDWWKDRPGLMNAVLG